MSSSIRAADAADIPSLEIIRRQAIEDGYAAVYDRGTFAHLVASPDADLPSRVESDEYLVLLAETDVTTVAYAVYDRAGGELCALYTAPDYQRQGYASELLAQVEDEARAESTEAISVTAPRNAVPFFESEGFERRETIEREGLTLHWLVKTLD